LWLALLCSYYELMIVDMQTNMVLILIGRGCHLLYAIWSIIILEDYRNGDKVEVRNGLYAKGDMPKETG